MTGHVRWITGAKSLFPTTVERVCDQDHRWLDPNSDLNAEARSNIEGWVAPTVCVGCGAAI